MPDTAVIHHPLKHKRVLITRPQSVATGFADKVSQLGGSSLIWPTIDIVPLAITAAQREQALNVDYAVFTSVHAVTYGAELIDDRLDMYTFAIGSRTAEALTNAGFINTRLSTSTSYSSETLLEDSLLSPANLKNKTIALITGEEGRELLPQTLEKRGAKVLRFDIYKRECPQTQEDALNKKMMLEPVDVITATSAECLYNLFAMCDNDTQAILRKTPIVLGNDRIQEATSALKFDAQVVIANNPTNDSMCEALSLWALN